MEQIIMSKNIAFNELGLRIIYDEIRSPNFQQYFIPPELVSGSAQLKYNLVKYSFQFCTIRALKTCPARSRRESALIFCLCHN